MGLLLVLLFLWFVVIWILAVNERTLAGFLLTVAAILLHDWWQPHDILGALQTHWPWTLAVALSWPPLGGLTSAFLWWRFVAKKARERADFMREKLAAYEATARHAGGQSPGFDGTFSQYLAQYHTYELARYKKPAASDHKWKITSWIAYWPWAVLWYILSDVLIRVWDHVYNAMHRYYDRITDAAWENG